MVSRKQSARAKEKSNMKAQDLKNSILQLAIQGKLVPQDANDESAEVLYAKIQTEKQKLIKEGKIKKDKPLPQITDDEIPFEIPSTWKWVRLGELCFLDNGKNTANERLPLLDAKYLRGKKTPDILETGVKINKGEYLILVDGENSGEVFLSPESGYMGSTFRKLYFFDVSYIDYILKILRFYQKKFRDNKKGGAIPHLDKNLFKMLLISMPPQAEQKRIVAKIEEFEPLVKQYDKAETELSALNDSFPEQLKKSILQYAIQGKLVAQDANDEPAEVLYAKIQAEKQKLIKEGKIKKDKPLPPITDDEIPFVIPSTWKWVRLGNCYDVRDGTHDSPKYVDVGYPLITSKDFNDGEIVFNKCNYISEEDHIKIQQRSKVDIGDILYSMIGGNIGNMAIVSTNKEFSIKNVALFKFYNKELTPNNYLYYILKYVTESFRNKAIGGAQPFIPLSFIRNFPIPFPPLAEQKRIVAKVNDLMQYCEELTHPEKRKEVEPITIEWLIDKGFDSCKQNGYTDVNAILDELGIAVMQDRNLKKGRIEYDNNKFQIWVNDLNDNWTKAHELVHYVNDNNEIKLYGAVGRKDETSLSKTKERNVDALTAEILMPEDIFVSAVEQDNIKKYAFVDNAVIRKLGKQFRVSDDAVKIRLQNLGYHTK